MRIAPAVVALAAFAADQVSKAWARATLAGRPARALWREHIVLSYTENRGGLFGYGAGPSARALLTISGVVSTVVLAAALVWRSRVSSDRLTLLALSTLLAGVAGNLVDRVAFGAVTDFIVLGAAGRRWPAFNVADVALSIGLAAALGALVRRPHASR